MNRTSRARRHAAALVGTVALVAGPLATAATAAEAPRPDKPAKAVTHAHGGGTNHLLRTVAGKDRRLARLGTSTAVTRLDDTYEVEVVAGIEESRAALAAIKDRPRGCRLDARRPRRCQGPARLPRREPPARGERRREGGPRARRSHARGGHRPRTTAATAAIEAAIDVTATSPKSELRAARAALRAAEAAGDDSEDTAPVS